MMILSTLCSIALRELIDEGCKRVGLPDLHLHPERAFKFLSQHFQDHGDRLGRALRQSDERAWRALEVALAGEGLFGWLAKAEDRNFRQKVRAFLDALPRHDLPGGAAFPKKALRELRYARKDGLIGGAKVSDSDLVGRAQELARRAGELARYKEPRHLLKAQWDAVDGIAGAVEKAGHEHLAHLLRLRPAQAALPPGAPPLGSAEPPLLVIAVRYFFRRAVEADPELYRGLTFGKIEGIAQAQVDGFAVLHEKLSEQGQSLQEFEEALE